MNGENPIYRERCPNFQMGPDRCCGARHDSTRKRYEGFIVELEYTDGRPSKKVSVFSLLKPDLDRNAWQTIRLESEEVQHTIQDWEYLTDETQDAIRDIHPGVFETSLDKGCQFRS